jgi:phospholipid-binding lipoprotein MlaA
MVYYRFISIFLVTFLLLQGCASKPTDVNLNSINSKATTEASDTKHNQDPLEPINRMVFSFNSIFDKTIVRPISILYRGVVPGFIRNRVTYSLNNLGMPVTAINNILQGELSKAGIAASRFLINSTFGILGFFDPASNIGLISENEDFGQTLAVWGVPSGPYIVIPFLGPSSPRNFTGMLSTSLLDPMYQVGSSSNQSAFRSYRMGVGAVDFRSQNIEILDDLQNNSLDYYAAVRSFYNQRRESQSMNNVESSQSSNEDDLDFYEDLDMDSSYIGPDIEIEYSE